MNVKTDANLNFKFKNSENLISRSFHPNNYRMKTGLVYKIIALKLI